MNLKRISDYHKTLAIIELYPCLQGEGARRGHPSFAIRTTGCTHRCYFGEDGGWCDTWYSSIHADKGCFSFKDILKLVEKHPHIKEIMLTGGSPTMHPELLNEISHLAHSHKLFVTLETEGSHFIQTDHPFDLISLSPKLSNASPVLNTLTPKNKTVTESFIKQHHKYRLNYRAMREMMDYHKDYQLKFVCDNHPERLQEILMIIDELGALHDKVYLMPAGSTREEMVKQYPIIMDIALQHGFKFTGRDHIIAYDDKIGV
ncbi:7-carboxy-7-deazaguanine synthase QueE [Fangia hongkongensis]|uniref:7-carboxy-7-deazaguanine synthase QueE n=1 Tax=Fangia hongkongensis TaxID=270495 RepID=UPI00036859ED|nr:7-carboxy-7-deazaguanine synthase QueE [Fangia hongkongensis]MBK2126191.1 7-carboxy-7-deazaguanine synthase QueE [Fangia hongkongensis]